MKKEERLFMTRSVACFFFEERLILVIKTFRRARCVRLSKRRVHPAYQPWTFRARARERLRGQLSFRIESGLGWLWKEVTFCLSVSGISFWLLFESISVSDVFSVPFGHNNC